MNKDQYYVDCLDAKGNHVKELRTVSNPRFWVELPNNSVVKITLKPGHPVYREHFSVDSKYGAKWERHLYFYDFETGLVHFHRAEKCLGRDGFELSNQWYMFADLDSLDYYKYEDGTYKPYWQHKEMEPC